jgi:hypothetical protein
MAQLVGRLIFYEYEGYEPALGVITACSPSDVGKTTVMFLDGFRDESFTPKQLKELLTPDQTNYIPTQWIQDTKGL